MNLLFRGQKIGSREWVCGHYLPGDDEICHIITKQKSMVQVYRDSVGLCSGKKDKRGQLIFTGQRVVDNEGVEGVVVFRNCAFRVDVNGGAFLQYNSSLLVRDGMDAGRFRIVGS